LEERPTGPVGKRLSAWGIRWALPLCQREKSKIKVKFEQTWEGEMINMKKPLTTRTAGFALIALIGVVMLFQIFVALGLLLPGQTIMLRISSFIASLVLLFALLVVLEKLGIIQLLRARRLINGILWFSAAVLFLSAVATLLLPGVIWLAFLALAGSGLSWVVARAPFIDKSQHEN
jgi:hypothetical protein